MPNQPKTPRRTIRIPDDIWETALEVAEETGVSLPQVVRDDLVRFIRQHRKGWKPIH
jgi:hypothetical protein